MLPETEPFWQAAKRHELVFQQCRACGQRMHFPRLMCHQCLSKDVEWIPSAGRGTVYSYTIVHQAAHESFASEVPYVYAIIDLDEGIRMISNVVGVEPAAVTIDMPVKVMFDDVTPAISIPRFTPA
ncbi:Zn-ribbon domain-containing OB-fold protein [Phycisphaerales bacterium AB-hyl4]|uniref:Zn-ribbon domain-containing OB-fold protein n=1 Tax=Natronomicrosphaera hydrolytica TaxID=3242702 RepID=A0ABV4U1F5_9BACT